MTAASPLERLSAGNVFAGKFQLEHEVAAGGMGAVWRATNTQLGIPVAVKVMAGAIAELPEFVARFEREAKAAAQIRSPNVVQIYEHGVHEGRPYMVMELLEGEDLKQRLAREKRLPLQVAVRIIRDICKALLRAHELGIVHRDLKPANVFLVRNMDDEIVKVLDFGIAKLTRGDGASITATGEMIGTLHYMSPEQIKAAKHVDHRADLWAVSAIAFRALTGQLPYTGHAVDVIQHIISSPVPVPSAIAPDLSPAVDAFFARALARDIGSRFQSARELSDELGRLAGRESLVEIGSPQVAGGAAGAAASLAPEADEAPTIAVARPEAAQPPASAAAVPPRKSAGTGTLPMGLRTKAEAFNADPSSPTAPPKRKLVRTMSLESPRPAPEPAAQPIAPAPVVAALSPMVLAGTNESPAAYPARRTSWIVWAVIATVIVVVAIVVWAAVLAMNSQKPEPIPLPAASAH